MDIIIEYNLLIAGAIYTTWRVIDLCILKSSNKIDVNDIKKYNCSKLVRYCVDKTLVNAARQFISSPKIKLELKNKVLEIASDNDIKNKLSEMLKEISINVSNDNIVRNNLKQMVIEIITDKNITKNTSSTILDVLYDLVVPKIK